MNFEPLSGVNLGAVEDMPPKYHVVPPVGRQSIARLAIQLEWASPQKVPLSVLPIMRAPVVRGSPYGTMEYIHATPLIVVQRFLNAPIIVDQTGTMECGVGQGNFSANPVLVQKEIIVQFDVSDHTWMIFVSEPMEFVCSSIPLPPPDKQSGPFIPGYVDPKAINRVARFELKALKPLKHGMVRVALANNCTIGISPVHCIARKPKDSTEAKLVMEMLREHADIYPTADADIAFSFPVDHGEEEIIDLFFNWYPASMSMLNVFDDANNDDENSIKTPPGPLIPQVELLMFALPHHQDKIHTKVGSSNKILPYGCVPTLHGMACPVVGGSWSIYETLSRISFHAIHPIREEMKPAIQAAVMEDLLYELPLNYKRGAGDTYFSGKMLAKLARVLIIAEEVGLPTNHPLFVTALNNLRSGAEIWLNGSAKSPLLYDRSWGGIVGCGCQYDGDAHSCYNDYPNCPALEDAGQNFGSGFYNDHHFHYGYHIYAAAVISRYDHNWAREFHQRVLTLIRDIANPSPKDPFFPTWRHKDFFLGSSWASGVVTISGKAYPNGRNQESSAESISAYEAVALYGLMATRVFGGSANMDDQVAYEEAMLIKEMGRLLLGMYIR